MKTLVLLLSLVTFAVVAILSTAPAESSRAAGPYAVQVVTPTATITPTVIFTVTVVVTATPEPQPTATLFEFPTATATSEPTPTPEPTATATPHVSVIPLPPGAPMILADIEADFMGLWSQIGPLQLGYYFTHGRPWQGGITHSVIPADGIPRDADRLLMHPTDVQENWLDFMPGFQAGMTYALSIDTYDGQEGRGFVANLSVYVDGVLWLRSIDYGGQERNQEWISVTP